MIELAIIAVRLVQYLGAAILFGLPLFFIYAVPGARPPGLAARLRVFVAVAAALLTVSSLLSIALQAALFSDSLREGFSIDGFESVVAFMTLGKAALIRAVLGGVAFLLAAVPLKRPPWWALTFLGGLAAASLAWMGHGAATDGPGHVAHLAANILHCLAASVWIGSLIGFLLLLAPVKDGTSIMDLHRALAGFSVVGAVLVATLAATGLLNGWFTVGTENLSAVPTTPYGRLLITKLVLFAAMLALAAANRFLLTPRLAARLDSGGAEPSIAALRRSVATEASLGLGVFALVAWFGTLPPPAV